MCVLAHYGTTIGQIFGWDGMKVDPERYRLVLNVVKTRYNQLLQGVRISDPINVFVKREPHKISKLEAEAYRLISGVSLVDSLVDRILFGWILRRMLSTVGKNPSMVGWSPVRGGWKFLKQYFAGKTLACLDKSSWDWTVQEWMIQAFMEFVLSLPVQPPDWWRHMVEMRFVELFYKARYRFKDGTEVVQNEWGIQKSGSLLTILMNTVLQFILHLVVDPTDEQVKIKIMGDDTVQEVPDDIQNYVSEVRKLGPRIKEVKVMDWIEFAGFNQYEQTCIPAYWKKHLFILKYAENPIQTLQSYQILYSHDPVMFAFVERELMALGGEPYPRKWCRAIMDVSD